MNVVGGLLLGVFVELFLAKGGGSQEFRLFLTTGLLGGFTTFSSFSLDAALGAYIALSVLLSIGALFLGMAVMRALT